MNIKHFVFLLTTVSLLTIVFSVQPILAYSESQYIPYSNFNFIYNLSPAGLDEGQKIGFIQNHPIRENIAEWGWFNLRVRAYAATPIGGTQPYRPNVNVTAELYYSGSFWRPFSYVESRTINPSIEVLDFKIPYDPFGNQIGNSSYGYSTLSMNTSGSMNYSIRLAQLYASADYWFSNHEALFEWAVADVKLKMITGAILTFYWTEIASIQCSSSPSVGYPILFIAMIRDGVPPYNIKWNFEGRIIEQQVQGKIGESVFTSIQYTFTTPGNYNITLTAIDSMGISDTKWILIKVSSVYLTIQTSIGGTTNPPPGIYSYMKGEQISIQALPSPEYVLGWWELDGVISGDEDSFRIIMDRNHTVKAIFVQRLIASLTAAPSFGLVPLNTTFTCITSGGLSPYSYELEFGDSGVFILNQSNFTTIQTWHVYSQAGNYNAKLTIVDSMGRKGYASTTVIVQNPLGLDITLSKSNDIIIAPGQTGTSIIYVNASRAEPVLLSMQWIGNVPADVFSSINPTSLIPNGTAMLIISADSKTPLGNYVCRIIGTAGNTTAYVDVHVSILQRIYYLTISSANGGTTEPPPGIYAHPSGSIVHIKAIPNVNWSLSAWRVDGLLSGGNEVLIIKMDGNRTIQPIFLQNNFSQSQFIIDVKYFEAGVWRSGSQSNPLDFSKYGAVKWNISNIELLSPITISTTLGSQISIQFDPLNTDNKFISTWGGKPKSKVWSARLYTTSGSYNNDILPSLITYPSSYSAIVLPPSSILEIKLKWMDYPINVTCNAPWGYVYVTSNSPGWELYDYSRYENGFGVYYVDHGHKFSITAIPFTGYYLDRIEVNGTCYYRDYVIIEDVRAPHDIKVYFSAISPTFILTIISTEGGTTIPSPGNYAVPRYSTQTIKAQVINASYYFTGWMVNGFPAGLNDSISIYMDGDKIAMATFDTDLLALVGPCSLINGNMFKRVIINEKFGINVTWQVPGVKQPTLIQVTAWLDSMGAWWWNGKKFMNTTYKFNGSVMTDSQGKFTIRFGSLDEVFYTTAEDAKVGEKFYAYANITVGSNTYNLISVWRIDNIMPWMIFNYNLTGVNATVYFKYSTDGSPIKGRAGYYAASISIYPPIVNNQFKSERLSTPCDENGKSWLWIPYSEMKQIRRGNASIIVWDLTRRFNSNNETIYFAITWAIRTNVTYSAIAAMIFFFNATHMLIEPIDWGSSNLLPIENAYAYLYWDTYEHPFNGRNGLIGIFGPSKIIPIIKEEWQKYRAYLNINGTPWPIFNNIKLSPLKNSIAAIVLQYPNAYELIYDNVNAPKRLYLFLVPGFTEGILYNPAVEMPDIIFHKPHNEEELYNS
ncbi:MAG: PKD domain-containing protein [Nitrososphaerota archaeon]|nr:PKD domain-containing protein [Nitrososphaerota archaeon]